VSTPVDVPIRAGEDGAATIRLAQFLKLANMIESGSDARLLMVNGDVLVNGVVETRRGRQLHVGDVVTLGGLSSRVTAGG
jgi:ribosome-associated protein